MDTIGQLEQWLVVNQIDEAIENQLMVLDFHPFQLSTSHWNSHLHPIWMEVIR